MREIPCVPFQGTSVGSFLKLPIGKAGVSQARTNRQNAPVLYIRHERNFAQALDHRVVVDENRGLVVTNPGNGFANLVRQVEVFARPVSRQVLRSAIDRAVLLDQAGTADADERREPEFLLIRGANE